MKMTISVFLLMSFLLGFFQERCLCDGIVENISLYNLTKIDDIDVQYYKYGIANDDAFRQNIKQAVWRDLKEAKILIPSQQQSQKVLPEAYIIVDIATKSAANKKDIIACAVRIKLQQRVTLTQKSPFPIYGTTWSIGSVNAISKSDLMSYVKKEIGKQTKVFIEAYQITHKN